jgi:hypothetical protein
VKKAIEKLESAKDGLAEAQDFLSRETIKDMLTVVSGIIDEALAILQAPPRWETPEQREKRTGEPWPGEAPVWERYVSSYSKGLWLLTTHKEAKGVADDRIKVGYNSEVVLATEAGPPPDGWMPEEGKHDDTPEK